MRYEKTWDQWVEAIVSNPGRWGKFNLSPGGAAAHAAVDRRTLDRAVADGRLDEVKIIGTRTRLIDSEGLERLRDQFATPEARYALRSAQMQRAFALKRGRMR